MQIPSSRWHTVIRVTTMRCRIKGILLHLLEQPLLLPPADLPFNPGPERTPPLRAAGEAQTRSFSLQADSFTPPLGTLLLVSFGCPVLPFLLYARAPDLYSDLRRSALPPRGMDFSNPCPWNTSLFFLSQSFDHAAKYFRRYAKLTSCSNFFLPLEED